MNRRLPALTLALLAAAALAACEQVKPGYIGLKVDPSGTGAGVECKLFGAGAYFLPGVTLQQYPVFTSAYTFSRAAGAAPNEEFSFQDNSGVPITADIGISYSIASDKACALFQKYRLDTPALLHGPIRDEIRSELIDAASQMPAQDINGAKKADVLSVVQAHVQAYFAPYGLHIDKLFWASTLRLPPAIQDQITARIADQNAAQASAQAQVAVAQTQAQQRVAAAQGEAQAIQIQAEALKTNPEYVQLLAVQKWDGHLPTYASDGPLPFIGTPPPGK